MLVGAGLGAQRGWPRRRQIVGVWESNEAARTTIERLFGPEALGEAEEHLKSFQGATTQPVR
jgi:hypothetical protein